LTPIQADLRHYQLSIAAPPFSQLQNVKEQSAACCRAQPLAKADWPSPPFRFQVSAFSLNFPPYHVLTLMEVGIFNKPQKNLRFERAQMKFCTPDSPGALSGRAERRDALTFSGGEYEGVAALRPPDQKLMCALSDPSDWSDEHVKL
jgi:hypothetical protein